MKTAEEISQDALKLDEPTRGYSLLELHLYITLKALYKQYHNKLISKEQGAKLKKLAMSDYYNRVKQNEVLAEFLKKHIANISKTEKLRMQLRHELKDKSENALNTAIELIEAYSGEGFKR